MRVGKTPTLPTCSANSVTHFCLYLNLDADENEWAADEYESGEKFTRCWSGGFAHPDEIGKVSLSPVQQTSNLSPKTA